MEGVEQDLKQLIQTLHRLASNTRLKSQTASHILTWNSFVDLQGTANAAGQLVVRYGEFVKDPLVTNTFEAPFGILRAARRRKIVAFDGELLLSPTHDHVNIVLLKNSLEG